MKTEAAGTSGTLPPTILHCVISEKATILIGRCFVLEITAEVFNQHVGYFRLFRDSAFGIATGYGLDGRVVGVRVPVGARLYSFPRRRDRFWGPPSLLLNGYLGHFPRG
jgi:hypothetical protein